MTVGIWRFKTENGIVEVSNPCLGGCCGKTIAYAIYAKY
jgi:hypothetical protein